MISAATQARTSRPNQTGILAFRLIPRLEASPAVVRFARTPLGQIMLLIAFGAGLRFFIPSWTGVLSLSFLLGLTTFMPEYRRFTLAVAPIVFLLKQTSPNQSLSEISLCVVATGILLYYCANRWPTSHFGKRPILFLLTGFALLLAFAACVNFNSSANVFIWTLVGAAESYLWFIAYALADRNSVPQKDLTLELAAFRPVWGSTSTPFPKGAAYLRRIEARNSEQLAIAQLKGLKLLLWAIILVAFSHLWTRFFHGYLRIPMSEDALAMSVLGNPAPWHLRWESLILAYFESILVISIWGHPIIAICRVAGFNALRNTYRPLSSTTLAEFFNRYYYYYKELLVDFFFYPVFLRYFKGHRRLRVVYATFAAAFFGNSFYHFVRDWKIIRDVGIKAAVVNYEASLLYCFILAVGLSISQVRLARVRPKSFMRAKLLPCVWVGFFYCLLNVLVTNERGYPLMAYLRYLASLFFIKI